MLLECTQHRGGTDVQRSRCITHATGIEADVNDLLLHLGQTPAIAIVEQKTPCDARGILAQGALGPATSFAAFDDLLAVTMGTVDCDKGHRPLIADGHSYDWAQCAINLSPSPLLEYYRFSYWNKAFSTQISLELLEIASAPALLHSTYS